MGGNYLRYVFAKENSEMYESENGGKERVFKDVEYMIPLEGINEKCRLSTEWVSSELGDNGTSGNYLRALIYKINERYSDVLKIFEESGIWYLEFLHKEFNLEALPECFHNNFAHRYINSLIAKPFVILTGNSGTGKTRIAKFLPKNIWKKQKTVKRIG